MRMNVLFTSHYEHLRMGGQQSMLEIIKHIDRNKVHPFALITADGELRQELENHECPTTIFTLPDVRRQFFLKRWLPEARKVFETVEKIRELIRSQNIHILHADEESDAVMCCLAAKGTHAKVIYHGRVSAPHKLDSIIAKKADYILGVSNSIYTCRFKEKNIDKKYQTIYDGADTGRFYALEDSRALRRQLNLPEDRFIVLFVGQIKLGKGILDLVDAFKIIRDQQRFEKMPQLVVAGRALEISFQEKVHEKINTNGLSDCVTLIGQQPQIQLWMQCADAIVLPSHEGTEGLGRVLFEGMMCGAVGITTNISGTNEVVSNEVGFLVPEKNPLELANAITHLAKNPELKKELRQKSIKSALERFDIRVHCRNIEKIYSLLCNQNRE